VVEVGVGQHDRVDGLGPRRERLGRLEVRHLALGTGLVTTVDEDARLRRREDEGGATDLATAPSVVMRTQSSSLVVGRWI